MTSPIEWPSFRRPLVAILRGIRPEETEAIIDALVEAGFEAIEIPLNSPEPFRSIEIAAKRAPSGCLIGPEPCCRSIRSAGWLMPAAG